MGRWLGVVAWVGLCGVALADEPPGQADAEQYTIDTSKSSAELKVGEKGKLSIVIKPAEGRKVHEQAPLSVVLRPSKGLALAKSKLGHADVSNRGEKSPELVVEVTATAAGPQVTEADMQFFICTEKWCERMMKRVSVTTQVK